MNKVREELERAHAQHVAAAGEPKKRRVRDWFRRQWTRRTSTSR